MVATSFFVSVMIYVLIPWKVSKVFDEMLKSIDINTLNYLYQTIRFPTFDLELMMKSETSKVAMKPPDIKTPEAFFL